MNIRKFSFAVAILSLFVIAVSLPTIALAAQGAPVQTPVEPPDTMMDLLTSLESLTGVAVLIAALVNAGKQLKIVQDGQAALWSVGLNLLALVGLFFAQVFGYSNLIPSLDQGAGSVGQILSLVLALVYQMIATRKTHDMALAGLPLIGFSSSGRVAGEPAYELRIADENYEPTPIE